MYQRTTISGPGYRYIIKHYGLRSGAPGSPRRKKRKRTSEEIERQNQSNRARNIRLLILGNFKKGWHIILTYPKEARPETPEMAKKELARFHRRMKRYFEKAGFTYKWIAVTEIGSRGAVHHHLILEDIHTNTFATQDAVLECWKVGKKNFSPLYEDGEYEALADYLAKKESKEDIPGCKVSHSRNLIMPKAKKERILRKRWQPEPKVPKGWLLVKDSLWNGINSYTGLPIQHYLLVQDTKSPPDE